jgi:CheY-like chemotaxis protein/two-component sensor histidine kinase
MMQYSGDTLMALLNDILDLTRIEMGKVELKKEHFKVQKLLDNCLPLYELQARKKGLDFSCVSVMVDSDVIYADPLRIKQIIINLVTNAIKYTAEGEIRVQLSLLEQMDTHGLKTLQITVEDTGEGIPPTFQEEVFNSFTQLNRERNSAIKGLGLGLAIVKNLVKYLGGNIQINSPRTPDTQHPGTRFVISLPVEKGFLRPALEPVSNSALSQFPSLKVLVAEDNEVSRFLIKSILDQADFEVALVENGQEALAYVQDNKVDLILMDVQMPVMDGYTATAEIRKFRPDLPILALSANAYREDAENSIRAGMNGHLNKPFKTEELAKELVTLFPQLVDKL